MRNDSNRDCLLEDVLGEAASPVFRGRLLERGLQEVRHRRRLRQLRRGILTAACVGLAVALAARFAVFEGVRSAKANSLLVRSRPLSAGMITGTKPRGVGLVNSVNTSVAFVRSSAGLYRVVGDEELLGLVAGRPAALVRRGPSEAELVFGNPADRDGFRVP
jgi:hypothetical protein